MEIYEYFAPKCCFILTRTLALVLSVPGQDEGEAQAVEVHQITSDEEVGEKIWGQGEKARMRQVAQMVNTKNF